LRALNAANLGKGALARALAAPLFALVGLAPSATETAIANGDTRTINLIEPHTGEAGSFTYMVNGVYDSSVLEKLNWFMRDWRHDEQTKMDPKLFDVVWEVYRESGSTEPVEVLSGYRSPETNAMLRRRSRQVAEHSQHILGKAMDAHFLDVPTSRIRDIALRMQDGGVGFYPTGISPWVHLDTGSVRYWPRMSRDALARLFPDGKTVFIPSDGTPLPGYELARAEIEARGGSVYAATAYAGGPTSLLSLLFGGGEEESENDLQANGDLPRGRSGSDGALAMARLGATGPSGHEPPAEQLASAKPDAVSLAKRNLPKGETFLQPTPAAQPKPQVVASLEEPKSDASAPAPAPASSQAAPTPPRRPSEFVSLILGFGKAPTPPARPSEFAALQTAAPVATDASQRSEALAAQLTRKLPGIITHGVGGALPSNALALADPDAPTPPERPALLAKAAALSAPLPPVAVSLPPLTRAARLTAVLPPVGPIRPTLVAATIDRSDFEVMTAPKTPTASPAGKALPAPSPRADAMVAALDPIAQSDGALIYSPYGDLRAETFGGPALRAFDESATVLDADLLRGTD
jgi:uncharacterized protein YcbK (DUF882 family)